VFTARYGLYLVAFNVIHFNLLLIMQPCTECLKIQITFFFLWRNSPTRADEASFLTFLNNTHTHTHLSKHDQLVAKSATNTTHKKHITRTSMPSAGFEPAIPAIEQPQTYSLDRTATGIGLYIHTTDINLKFTKSILMYL
jgi:hypothetical protein